MKIFVSHAAVDHFLANQFVDLLHEGTGLAKDDIFCSSKKGSIPTGEEFVQIILQRLAGARMVVLLISSPFLQSQFCLAETGAAQMRKKTGNLERIFPLVIPPAIRDDLKGVLLGSQAALITDETALGSIRDYIAQGFPGCAPLKQWVEGWQKFREAAMQVVVAYQLEETLKIATTRWAIYFADDSKLPGVQYPMKLRLEFRNYSGEVLQIDEASWSSGLLGISTHPKALNVLPWQLKTGLRPQDWSGEGRQITIKNEAVFRTWVGLNTTEADVWWRIANQRLGKMVVSGTIGRQRFTGRDLTF